MTATSPTTLLDGAMGSALEARGVSVSGPGWSARALLEAPAQISRLHAEYAAAGATVHTANTFRATPEGAQALGVARFEALIDLAVGLARRAIPPGHRVAGSLSPAADCYGPAARPADYRPRHARVAGALAAAGVDVLLCETFVDGEEALAAVEACARFDRPVWLALSGGPTGALATPDALRAIALRAVGAGAGAVLVNCTAAPLTLTYVEALADLPVPIGAYANVGRAEDLLGELADWGKAPSSEAELAVRAARYAALAAGWQAAGASLIGGCCGTTPAHVRALRERLAGT